MNNTQTTPIALANIKAGDRVKHFDGIKPVLAVHVLTPTLVEVNFGETFTIGGPADCLPVLV